ncbi:MAG TPA: phage holin family protein [Qipengyuania sp.]|nr:phage holin family protein [Qipengyuania sp.]
MNRAEDSLVDTGTAPSPSPLSSDMPDAPPVRAPDASGEPSLKSDIDALIADGKTYLEAELAYQKSRAGFAANRLKWTAIYGAAAFGLLHLALIALTVGVVIALTPLTGPWIATAIVVALLLTGALVFVLRLRSKVGDIRSAFEDAP